MKMTYKQLGRTATLIPEVGIGTWNYHAGPLPLRRGLESGALFVDTAESYGTEYIVREAVHGMRDRVFIATKVSPQNFRPVDLRKSVDASLRNLGTETIDLLQLHEPNPSIPIGETMEALAGLVDAGKIRFVGVSNFSVSQLKDAQQAFRHHPIVSNQVRYSIIDRTIESGLLQYCQTNHVTVIAYSPLGRGFDRIRDCDPTRVLDEVARSTGRSPAQIAINWCLCKEGVVAIPKGNSVEHILENCSASDFRLTAEQLSLLDSRIQHRRRNRFDTMVRGLMPKPLQNVAQITLNWLPAGIRRRVR